MTSNLDRETHIYLWFRERLLAEHESLKDDEAALNDTLEGITHLNEAIEWTVQRIAEDEEMLDGIRVRQQVLDTRSNRIERRIETRRNLILETLQKTDKKRIDHPEFTITRKSSPRRVIITDESKLPHNYFRQQPALPDKKTIKEILVQGQEVPGAELSEPTENLVIRRG